jgi:hypothetical protein
VRRLNLTLQDSPSEPGGDGGESPGPSENKGENVLVAQVRQALQHAVAIGACSAARFASGNIRVVALNKMPRVCPSV